MRTSRLVLVAIFTGCLAAGSALAGGVTFRSPDDALHQGISAFNGGYYELALPAFEALEATKPQVARFFMARIYGDNEGAFTDHPRAFKLYQALADELKDIDPDDEELGPIAAKSLTALSIYLRSGITAAGLSPDPYGADRALQRAALTFNDEDAQFELAKVLLRGEGPQIPMTGDDAASKIQNGRHWLSRLSRSGHAGAQAFLADLLWRGRFVEKDQVAALNLIDVAIANAPANERVWIDDIYQNIFCHAGEGVRLQATGRVAKWHRLYGRAPDKLENKSGLDALAAEPVRTCANGEAVHPMPAAKEQGENSAIPAQQSEPQRPPVNLGVPAGVRSMEPPAFAPPPAER